MAQGFLSDPDEFVQKRLAAARAAVDRRVDEVTLYAQREPQKALVAAAVTGFCFTSCPVASSRDSP